MRGKQKKTQREKNLTSRYLSGEMDEDRIEHEQRFGQKSADSQQQKIERTAMLRAADGEIAADVDALPLGQVVQVHSRYCEVDHEGVLRLCTLRKTFAKLIDTFAVTGDLVRFRETGSRDEGDRPETVIEQIVPRRTVLTRSDSFKAIEQQPIVANADQVLLVASLIEPNIKWGLIDRMLVASSSGNLRPILCVNKIDLVRPLGCTSPEYESALPKIEHYRTMGITVIETSVTERVGLDELRSILKDQTTVLAGHSGVGKSSLIRAIQPALDLRIAPLSGYTGKGRHTTTTARIYKLDFGGQVIDTPGVKLFGLWNVTRENLGEYFPDVAADTAPPWRTESYQRIMESLPESGV